MNSILSWITKDRKEDENALSSSKKINSIPRGKSFQYDDDMKPFEDEKTPYNFQSSNHTDVDSTSELMNGFSSYNETEFTNKNVKVEATMEITKTTTTTTSTNTTKNERLPLFTSISVIDDDWSSDWTSDDSDAQDFENPFYKDPTDLFFTNEDDQDYSIEILDDMISSENLEDYIENCNTETGYKICKVCLCSTMESNIFCNECGARLNCNDSSLNINTFKHYNIPLAPPAPPIIPLKPYQHSRHEVPSAPIPPPIYYPHGLYEKKSPVPETIDWSKFTENLSDNFDNEFEFPEINTQDFDMPVFDTQDFDNAFNFLPNNPNEIRLDIDGWGFDSLSSELLGDMENGLLPPFKEDDNRSSSEEYVLLPKVHKRDCEYTNYNRDPCEYYDKNISSEEEYVLQVPHNTYSDNSLYTDSPTNTNTITNEDIREVVDEINTEYQFTSYNHAHGSPELISAVKNDNVSYDIEFDKMDSYEFYPTDDSSDDLTKYIDNSSDNSSDDVGEGNLELIVGPMFSGKSTEIILKLARMADVGYRVLYVNHSDDNRVTEAQDSVVSTHNSQYNKLSNKISSVKVSQLDEVDINGYDFIGVDEGQFFPDLYEMIIYWVTKCGKDVMIASLDGDSYRRKFGQVLDLIPHADKVTKKLAYCDICRHKYRRLRSAPFTGRLVNTAEAKVVGGHDIYRAMCRECHDIHLSQTVL